MRFLLLNGTQVWAIGDKPYDRDNPCRICQISGKLIMDDLEFKSKTELLPYISSNLIGDRGVLSNNPIDYGKASSEVGFGVKYDLSSSSSIERTINPDFSQVEADETQIDINSAFCSTIPRVKTLF